MVYLPIIAPPCTIVRVQNPTIRLLRMYVASLVSPLYVRMVNFSPENATACLCFVDWPKLYWEKKLAPPFIINVDPKKPTRIMKKEDRQAEVEEIIIKTFVRQQRFLFPQTFLPFLLFFCVVLTYVRTMCCVALGVIVFSTCCYAELGAKWNDPGASFFLSFFLSFFQKGGGTETTRNNKLVVLFKLRAATFFVLQLFSGRQAAAAVKSLELLLNYKSCQILGYKNEEKANI